MPRMTYEKVRQAARRLECDVELFELRQQARLFRRAKGRLGRYGRRTFLASLATRVKRLEKLIGGAAGSAGRGRMERRAAR